MGQASDWATRDAERMCDPSEGLTRETGVPALIVGQHSLCPRRGDSLLPAFRAKVTEFGNPGCS